MVQYEDIEEIGDCKFCPSEAVERINGTKLCETHLQEYYARNGL